MSTDGKGWWKYTLFRHACSADGHWSHRARRVPAGSRQERDIAVYDKDKRTFFTCSPFFDSPLEFTFLQADTYVAAEDEQEALRKGLEKAMPDLMKWTSELEKGLRAFAAANLPGKRGSVCRPQEAPGARHGELPAEAGLDKEGVRSQEGGQ